VRGSHIRFAPSIPNIRRCALKKLQGGGEFWSVRIGEQYRAVGCVPATRFNGFGPARTTSSTIYFREHWSRCVPFFSLKLCGAFAAFEPDLQNCLAGR
jgi:hypothetical protein